MRKHPVLGVEHLVRFELPWDVEATVRGHHERYDGTGYPDGLAGDAIPLGAGSSLSPTCSTRSPPPGRTALHGRAARRSRISA